MAVKKAKPKGKRAAPKATTDGKAPSKAAPAKAAGKAAKKAAPAKAATKAAPAKAGSKAAPAKATTTKQAAVGKTTAAKKAAPAKAAPAKKAALAKGAPAKAAPAKKAASAKASPTKKAASAKASPAKKAPAKKAALAKAKAKPAQGRRESADDTSAPQLQLFPAEVLGESATSQRKKGALARLAGGVGSLLARMTGKKPANREEASPDQTIELATGDILAEIDLPPPVPKQKP